MPKLQFNGNRYYGGKYRFTQPGIYDVDEAKSEQLLADFPDQFEIAGDEQKTGKPVSKMNREELEAYAVEIGLEVTDEMKTNKDLQEAIKAHQES